MVDFILILKKLPQKTKSKNKNHTPCPVVYTKYIPKTIEVIMICI